MADEYQVIDDPNDPRLRYDFDPSTYGTEDTPAPAPVTNLFDPAAYAEGKEKKVEQPPALPTFTPRKQTYYYPSTPEDTRAKGLSYSMEGGIHGAGKFSDLDLRNHTIEKYDAGESPFVATAMAGVPTGAEFNMVTEGKERVHKQVDTGGGLIPGQADIATSNPDLARGGGSGSGFDPKAYADGNPSVPDIHAFLEPSPADTPEGDTAEEPSAGETIGKAIGKGISKFGEALSNRPIPEFKTPEFHPTPIPQAAAPQTQVIPGQGMIGAAIPTAQPLPTPGGAPQDFPVMQGTREGLHQTAAGLVPHTMEQFTTLAQTLGAPTDPQSFFVSALKQGLVTADVAKKAIEAGPLSKEAGVAYGTIIPQALMMLGGLHGAGAVPSGGAVVKSFIGANQFPHMQEVGAVGRTGGGREVPVPESGQAPIVPMTQPQGLPVKAASVQGLKNPPAIQKMRSDVATLKSQGKHAEAKALQGQINQLEGLSVGPNAGQPPTPPVVPPQAPPPQNPPPGGGVPPQPPKSVPEVLRNRQITDRVASGHDSVFTRADYDARQKVNPLRQEFGEHVTKGENTKANKQADKDMEAATFIAEAQGNKIALAHDLELVRNSKNKKLAKKYEPILKYAVDNFTRIKDTLAKSRYEKLMQEQLAEDAASGITYDEREGYVTHVLKNESPDSLISFFTGKMGSGGLSRYFTKSREFGTLAEAINAGVDPASVNLADLAQHRIAASRRLILNKALFNELKNIHDQAGNPVLKGVFRHPDPPHGPVVPKGYELMNLNGVEVSVHPSYSGIFKSLYGDSALRRTAFGRTVMRAAGISKSYTLAADTYHGFRGIQKGFFYGKGKGRLGYTKGTTVYELSNEGLDTAVKNGEISQSQADWAKSARPAVEEMMANGLNVSNYADNLVGQLHVAFPGTKGLNNWIFNRVFRGAMIQASHANYLRNLKRFPELTKREVARRTAKEMNEVFGNLMNQGLLKDKTIRDAAQLTFLAPQWVESQARAEFRGYGQAAQIIPDAMKGKFRVGTVAQGQATAVLAYLLGNQIINYATTGHSTFENDEHKLSAFLPIGERGVYLNPLALSAEYVDRVVEKMGKDGGNLPDAIAEIGRSKLSRTGQAVVTAATGRDWRGRKLDVGDRITQVVKDVVPVPIGVSSVGGSLFSSDPNATLGFSFDPQYDKITQGVLQAMGQRGVLGSGGEAQYPQAPVRVPSRGARQKRGVY